MAKVGLATPVSLQMMEKMAPYQMASVEKVAPPKEIPALFFLEAGDFVARRETRMCFVTIIENADEPGAGNLRKWQYARIITESKVVCKMLSERIVVLLMGHILVSGGRFKHLTRNRVVANKERNYAAMVHACCIHKALPQYEVCTRYTMTPPASIILQGKC